MATTISAEQLAHDYYPFVLNLARQVTNRDEEQAQDLAQETFYKALRALPGLQERKDPHAYGGWLTTILRRTWIDWCRRPKRMVYLPEERWEMLPAEGKFEEEIGRYEPLYQVLAHLSEEQRQILLLRCQGVGMERIAQRCGLMHLHRATRYRHIREVEQTAKRLAAGYS